MSKVFNHIKTNMRISFGLILIIFFCLQSFQMIAQDQTFNNYIPGHSNGIREIPLTSCGTKLQQQLNLR